MSLQLEKTFVVSDDETGEKVILSKLDNGNYSIKINSLNGEIKEETFEEVGKAIQEMCM